MTLIDQLRALGYRIVLARAGVYFVDGFGVQTYVAETDTATWQSLLDSHSSRANPPPHVPTVQETNTVTLRDRATQALTTNATFMALASPTNAQTLAQVKALTRQSNALIRLALPQLDDISDTV